MTCLRDALIDTAGAKATVAAAILMPWLPERECVYWGKLHAVFSQGREVEAWDVPHTVWELCQLQSWPPHKSGWRTLCALYTLSILVVSSAISEKRESAILKGVLTGAETATVANDLILNCLETLDPAFLSLLGVAIGRLREAGLFRMRFAQRHLSSRWLESISAGSCPVVN